MVTVIYQMRIKFWKQKHSLWTDDLWHVQSNKATRKNVDVRKQTCVSFLQFNVSINPRDATSGAGAKLCLPRSPSSVSYPIFSIYQNLSGGSSWSSTAAGLATPLACPAATEHSVLQMTRATTPRGESGRPATRTLACHLCTTHLGLSPCHSAPGARLDSNSWDDSCRPLDHRVCNNRRTAGKVPRQGRDRAEEA